MASEVVNFNFTLPIDYRLDFRLRMYAQVQIPLL